MPYPDKIEEAFILLAIVRESGKCNMFGSGQYLTEHLGIPSRETRRYVMAYMNQDKNKKKLLGDSRE